MISLKCIFFLYVCLHLPRLILRGGWGCAQFCWTPLMMAILKGPNCHTATEDCTRERPAPQLQDPPIPVMGLAVAEVQNIIWLVEVMRRITSPSFGTCVLSRAVVDVKIRYVFTRAHPNRLAWAAHYISTFWSMCLQWRACVKSDDRFFLTFCGLISSRSCGIPRD